jgi:N-acyl-phosphatidylethanolamine-hydrolysing phospholipase D
MYEEFLEDEKTPSYHFSCPVQQGRYKNPYVDDIRRRIWDFLLWQLGKYDHESFRITPPRGFHYPNPQEDSAEALPRVSWMNHSTFHVDYKGVHLLTDPIWSNRCSPFSFIGPKRLHYPPLEIEELPHIDVVLISHNHYDHLDKTSILDIFKKSPQALFIVPEGVGAWFKKQKIYNYIELSWWQNKEVHFSKELTLVISSVPSQHFSGRGVLDKNKTLWCGWVVQFFERGVLAKQLYFVGDTGYNSYDFVNIGKEFGYFDLSLIPIGTYMPFTFMSPVHICPNKAVQIHQEVNSKLSVGMHWKTFRLSDETLEQPPYDLYLAMKEMNLDPLTFRVLHPGQRINW